MWIWHSIKKNSPHALKFCRQFIFSRHTGTTLSLPVFKWNKGLFSDTFCCSGNKWRMISLQLSVCLFNMSYSHTRAAEYQQVRLWRAEIGRAAQQCNNNAPVPYEPQCLITATNSRWLSWVLISEPVIETWLILTWKQRDRIKYFPLVLF